MNKIMLNKVIHVKYYLLVLDKTSDVRKPYNPDNYFDFTDTQSISIFDHLENFVQ